MKKREGKIPIFTLVIVTFITILFMTIELSVKIHTTAPFYHEKLEAARMTSQAFKTIHKAVDSLHILIDPVNDPNLTGLIGLQFSPLTVERSDLQAKLTATNPNIAAMIIHLLKRAHVHRDDTVAVYMTGSTPALNIALITAIETIGAIPIIVTSVSSSMWGANYPDLTMLDMERVLDQAQIISSGSSCATLGGHDETGRGLSPEGRALIESSIARNHVTLLGVHDVNDALEQILEVFRAGKGITVFVTTAEQATVLTGYDLNTGFIPAYSVKQGNGLIPYFSQIGVPTINLAALNTLAQEYGIPIAPRPLPGIGQGPLYYEYRYSVVMAFVFLFLLCVVLFFALQYDIEAVLKRSST